MALKIVYYFRVRVGKQVSRLTVESKGYSRTNYTISNGRTIKFCGFNTFKVDEKRSSKRWPKYMNCTINGDGLQVEFKGQINNIEVRTSAYFGFNNVISFEAYE